MNCPVFARNYLFLVSKLKGAGLLEIVSIHGKYYASNLPLYPCVLVIPALTRGNTVS